MDLKEAVISIRAWGHRLEKLPNGNYLATWVSGLSEELTSSQVIEVAQEILSNVS